MTTIEKNLNPQDVFTARRYLLHLVPAELANRILDEAEYWPRLSFDFEPCVEYKLQSTSAQDYNVTKCMLLSDPIPKIEGVPVKVVKVYFYIRSHDQGWGGEIFPHPYEGSCTWFEAAIVRSCRYEHGTRTPDTAAIQETLETRDAYPKIQRGPLCIRTKDISPSPIFFGLLGNSNPNTMKLTTVKNPTTRDSDVWEVQRNLRANSQVQYYELTWTRNTDEGVDEEAHYQQTGGKLGTNFVRCLRSGDRIALLARAQYPGWENCVRSIAMDIYLAV